MAKSCSACGKTIGFMDTYRSLEDNRSFLCNRCEELMSAYNDRIWSTDSIEEIADIKAEASVFIASKASEIQNIDPLYQYLEERINDRLMYLGERKTMDSNSDNSEEETIQEPDPYEEMCSKMLLSIADRLEGYHITKQLGVVFGETVFKPSAGQQLTAAFGDFFRAFSFSAKEMAGQVSLIEEARKYAYMKMMKSALDRGANAIIAIDSDNTLGDNTCYLSLYGTAVYVEADN